MKNTFDDFFSVNEQKAREGAEYHMGDNANNEPVILYIAEAGNPDHEKWQRKFAKRLERSRGNDNRQREVMAEIVARSILKSWAGVIDGDGKAIEPTFENKFDALKKYKRMFSEVLEFATDQKNFVDDDDLDGIDETAGADETEKNSEAA